MRVTPSSIWQALTTEGNLRRIRAQNHPGQGRQDPEGQHLRAQATARRVRLSAHRCDHAGHDCTVPRFAVGKDQGKQGNRPALPCIQHGKGMGLTTRDNPCLGVRKNKEKPRNYYANEAVWKAVYEEASEELKDAMDLAYLTGQRPADVLSMRRDDMEGIYLLVSQGKTGKRLRIMLQTNGVNNSLGTLLERIMRRNSEHLSPFFILNSNGKRLSWEMLRNRWQDARETARVKAISNKQPELANRIAQFQFRDIRPKAASEINDLTDASLLLGHSKEGITERVYRRVGAIAKPSKG